MCLFVWFQCGVEWVSLQVKRCRKASSRPSLEVRSLSRKKTASTKTTSPNKSVLFSIWKWVICTTCDVTPHSTCHDVLFCGRIRSRLLKRWSWRFRPSASCLAAKVRRTSSRLSTFSSPAPSSASLTHCSAFDAWCSSSGQKRRQSRMQWCVLIDNSTSGRTNLQVGELTRSIHKISCYELLKIS